MMTLLCKALEEKKKKTNPDIPKLISFACPIFQADNNKTKCKDSKVRSFPGERFHLESLKKKKKTQEFSNSPSCIATSSEPGVSD